MGRARYNTGLFPLPDNVLPVQLFGGTSLSRGEILDADFFLIIRGLLCWNSPLERGGLGSYF